MGYNARLATCNRPGLFRACLLPRALLLVLLALPAAGCSLTMHLTSFKDEPETTGSITMPRGLTKLDEALDDEDWRRAQSALSLAVDPQGPGLSVNWDNPASKRKGSFAPTGEMKLVKDTICRPFTATIVQPGKSDIRREGQACRVGPGEWAMLTQPGPEAASETKTSPSGKPQPLTQPLPARTTATLMRSTASAAGAPTASAAGAPTASAAGAPTASAAGAPTASAAGAPATSAVKGMQARE